MVKKTLAEIIITDASGESSGPAEKPDVADRPTLRSVLEDEPPGHWTEVADARYSNPIPGRSVANVRFGFTPAPIRIHCDHPQCGRAMFHDLSGDPLYLQGAGFHEAFVRFICRNCKETGKSIALAIQTHADKPTAVFKLGEVPPFGPPLPSKLVTLLRDDRDLLSQARRSESQSLGIGSFAYYRRVVDNQWKRLLRSIIEVAEKTGSPKTALEVLRSAGDVDEFSRAVEMVKDAIPESLKIGTDNPLTLLYSALSDGVHERDDDECLERAAAVRRVLVALAERVATALSDESELRAAVGKLKERRPKPSVSSAP